MKLHRFTFNEFEENTYILYDETMECAIIDPGCNSISEQSELSLFIKDKNLIPRLFINTHCHIDHVFGNKFISDNYNLQLIAHEKEIIVLNSAPSVALLYHMQYEASPNIEIFIHHDDVLRFGNTELKVIFTPGHSPGSVSLYNEKHGVLISGDVLFQKSIGRTDLPGGDYDVLIHSIKTQLLKLPEDVKVFPGHGNSTTIGIEKKTNPFF